MDTIEQTMLPEQHPFWKHFSGKTLTLIFVLLVVTGGLLYLAIRQEQPASSPMQKTPNPIQSSAHSVLSIVPETSSNSATQTADILIQSNANKITGAQLSIAYDPNVLTNVTIKPGPYITNPVILFHTVDAVNGRISYVLDIQPTGKQATGSGILATISYTLLATSAATTKLSFLPKTEVTQEGIVGSVLKTATDLLIPIPQALQISPVVSPTIPVQSSGY